ncbi:MAG: hypothetical protein WCO56_04395 [Verrucomicrobiota bacterium]
MESVNINSAAQSALEAHVKPATLLKRRSLWLIVALIVVGAGAFGYHWAFGKAKILYVTATVERGDVESTVVAAGIAKFIA